jgi:hypothetical protein
VIQIRRRELPIIVFVFPPTTLRKVLGIDAGAVVAAIKRLCDRTLTQPSAGMLLPWFTRATLRWPSVSFFGGNLLNIATSIIM